MNKIVDLLEGTDFITNRPAKIYVTITALRKADVKIEGDFADILGASFDFVVGLIEKSGLNPIVFTETIRDRGKAFFSLLSSVDKNVLKAAVGNTMLFDIDENSNINFRATGCAYGYILGVISMVNYIVKYYDLDYDEYIEFFFGGYNNWLSSDKRKDLLAGKYDKK